MNVTLIPFFLAANVIVNDTSEWKLGPEYTYNLNMTYTMKSDPHEPDQIMQLFSTVKCRPKVPDSLFCHLQNSTTVMPHKDGNMTREVETAQMFEINFDERGVGGLMIEPPSHMEVVNVIRKIANQFNVGADLKRKIGMPQFMARENSSMGDCATVYTITDEAIETDATEQGDTDFRLVVLLMPDAKPGTILSIEKSRIGCINPPRYVDFATGILKMGRFYSKIQVSDRFETVTEMDGKIRFPTDSTATRMISFKEMVQLNLDNIKPAKDELSSIPYGEWIDLNINTDIPSNFID
nr:PREDICTED: uncharacterized protein LOC105671684 isoform X1 [Linepithema humile]